MFLSGLLIVRLDYHKHTNRNVFVSPFPDQAPPIVWESRLTLIRLACRFFDGGFGRERITTFVLSMQCGRSITRRVHSNEFGQRVRSRLIHNSVARIHRKKLLFFFGIGSVNGVNPASISDEHFTGSRSFKVYRLGAFVRYKLQVIWLPWRFIWMAIRLLHVIGLLFPTGRGMICSLQNDIEWNRTQYLLRFPQRFWPFCWISLFFTWHVDRYGGYTWPSDR